VLPVCARGSLWVLHTLLQVEGATLHCLSFICLTGPSRVQWQGHLWMGKWREFGRNQSLSYHSDICFPECARNSTKVSVVSYWRGRVANRPCLEYRYCNWSIFKTCVHNCNYNGPLLRHNWCFLPSITGVVKRMTWCGGGGMCYVQGREEIHAGFLIGGKPWHGWEDNIKIDLGWAWTGLIWLSIGESGEMWTQWWTSPSVKCGECLASWGTFSFSRTAAGSQSIISAVHHSWVVFGTSDCLCLFVQRKTARMWGILYGVKAPL
jgi:hypothetical protein